MNEAASAALREADEDFWLAAQFAPEALRDRLTALFLLRAEIVRVPGAVREPALGEMRLQWWREAIAALPEGKAPKGQPALAAAEGAALLEHLPADVFDRAIEARSRLLYDPYFASEDALSSWLRVSEGSYFAAALRLAEPDASPTRLDAARAAGAAFMMARSGRALLAKPETPIDAAYETLIAEARRGLNGASDAVRGVLLVCALAPLYLRKPNPSGLARRWRLFRATLTGALFGR